MIQGGGMDADLKAVPTKPPVVNEKWQWAEQQEIHYRDGSHTTQIRATSQFFINSNDNLFLDREKSQDGFGYAVFGTVVEGKDVVDKIEGTKTGVKTSPRGIPMRDVPEEPIVIKKPQYSNNHTPPQDQRLQKKFCLLAVEGYPKRMLGVWSL